MRDCAEKLLCVTNSVCRDRKTRSESSVRSLESLSLPSIKTHSPIIVTGSDQMELSSRTFGHDSTGVLLELPAGPTSPRPLQSHPNHTKCTDKLSEPLVKATLSDIQPPSPTRNWFLDLHDFPGSDFAANQTRPLDRSEVYLESRRYGDTAPPVLPRETAKRPIVPNRKIRKRQTTTPTSRPATPRDSGIATPSTGRSTPEVVNRMSPVKGLLYTICAAPVTPPMSRHGSQDSGSTSPSFDLYPATVKIPSRQERARLSDRTPPSESESDQAPNKALPALPSDTATPRAAIARSTPRRMSPNSSRPSIEVPPEQDSRRANTPSPLPRPRISYTSKPGQPVASPWEYSKDLLLESLASLDTSATEAAIEKLRTQVQARKLQNSQGQFAKCLIGPTSALESGHAQGSLLVGLQNEALRKENARLRAALHIFMVNS